MNKVIAYDETGGRDRSADPYRIEGWEFIISGGAVYDHLDLSFSVGNEEGGLYDTAPGGGGPELRRQLAILKDFMTSFDFVRMKPDDSIVEARRSKKVTVRALMEEGRAYAVYVKGGSDVELIVRLPSGTYKVDWVNTKTGVVIGKDRFDHAGGRRTLTSPKYTGDIALRIVSADLTRD